MNRTVIVYSADHVQVNGEVFPGGGEGDFGLVVPRNRSWGATLSASQIRSSLVLRTEVAAGNGTMVPGRDQEDMVVLALVEHGEVRVSPTHGPSFSVVQGDVFLYRTNQVYDVVWKHDCRVLAAGVPYDILDEFGLSPDVVDGPLTTAHALMQPALRFLDSAADTDESASALEAYFVEKLVQEMVGALLLSNRGIADAVENPRSSMYDRALRLMTARRSDPELMPEIVARDLNVSLRHLQRVFSQHGTSVAATLRRLRVEQALQLLQDERYDVLSVPEIARHAGFNSPQLLRRALNAHGRGSPLEIRAQRSG
ncbi:hypothetical protein GCM10027591_12640 [Zhihengliuella somnathii]